ncbi:hypothetical protein EG68_09443 [Paragonimus skrjabini miyazakii]|uniref:Uncharacterized protein n=1 Tax=Paragonimus skrjabini miyazakii TaxID=59628 RepID=A0A8S9YTA4_9TREM|nr:hypothetical protein EG68_09443 [Paragonimus skrjabini miyazakii]
MEINKSDSKTQSLNSVLCAFRCPQIPETTSRSDWLSYLTSSTVWLLQDLNPNQAGRNTWMEAVRYADTTI